MQTTAKELVPASNGLLPWHPDIQLQATGMQSAAKKSETGKISNFSTPFPSFFFQPGEAEIGSFKTQADFYQLPGIPSHQGDAALDPNLNPHAFTQGCGSAAVYKWFYKWVFLAFKVAPAAKAGLHCTAVPPRVSCHSSKTRLCAQDALDKSDVTSSRDIRGAQKRKSQPNSKMHHSMTKAGDGSPRERD